MKIGYFLAGAGSTLFIELIIFFSAAVVYAIKNKKKDK